MASAEDMMNSYYTLKELNDETERRLAGKAPPLLDWDTALAAEEAKQEDIRRHRFDEEYARKMVQAELERGDKLRDASIRKSIEENDEKKRLEKEREMLYREDMQRNYERRREEEEREREYEEERRREREEEQYRRYEEEKRRQEEYERMRKADEEYYEQLRRRNY